MSGSGSPSSGRWASSDRVSRLPGDWEALRQLVLARDGHRCTHVAEGQRCTQAGTEVDHVVAGDDHDPSNLTALCRTHHKEKTGREAAAARWGRPSSRATRAPERHPGLLPPRGEQ